MSFGAGVAGAWVTDLFSPFFAMYQCLRAAKMGFGVGGAVYADSGRVVGVFGRRGCMCSAVSRRRGFVGVDVVLRPGGGNAPCVALAMLAAAECSSED